jgi:hypothetical protein
MLKKSDGPASELVPEQNSASISGASAGLDRRAERRKIEVGLIRRAVVKTHRHGALLRHPGLEPSLESFSILPDRTVRERLSPACALWIAAYSISTRSGGHSV